jgi:hypothetical protein
MTEDLETKRPPPSNEGIKAAADFNLFEPIWADTPERQYDIGISTLTELADRVLSPAARGATSAMFLWWMEWFMQPIGPRAARPAQGILL